MSTLLIIILVIVLLGGGGGYYGYNRYGNNGLGGAVGLVLVVLLILWLVGAFHGHGRAPSVRGDNRNPAAMAARGFRGSKFQFTRNSQLRGALNVR